MQTSTHGSLALQALALALLLPVTLPVSAHDQEGDYRLLELDGYKVKWGEKRLGAGASISYAFADQPMRFDDALNCVDLAPMEVLSSQDLAFETLKRETAAAFETWEQAADLSFHRVDDPLDANIILGAQGKPVGQAFASVSYLPGSHEGVRTINQALVCLNPEHSWKVGFDGDTDVYDIRYTLIHEIGHAIGLDHPGAEGQVMGFRYTEAFAELQPGDMRGVRRLYGHSANDNQLASNDSGSQALQTPVVADEVEMPASLSIE